MNTISQIARFRQSVVTYSFHFGVPAAEIHKAQKLPSPFETRRNARECAVATP